MLRSVTKAAYRLGQEVLLRFQNGKFGLKSAQQATKVVQNPAVQKVIIQQINRLPAFSRNLFLRTFQRTVRSRVLFLRPFAAFHYQRLAHFNDDRRNYYQQRFRGLYKIQKRKNVGVIERIRDIFGSNVRYNQSLANTEFPDCLDGYDIGKHIAGGCSGAVYELRKKNPQSQFNALSLQETSTIQENYPLALKIMFNYDYNRSEKRLCTDMATELVPLIKKPNGIISGSFGDVQLIPKHHPNVIKLHTAFTDIMPILPDANKLYPAALPNNEDYIPLEQEPKTLFIVMKRYHMTLRNYMLTCKRNYWTLRIMYGQLLESIVFLYDHKIAHRDMKSDNILLDFDYEDDLTDLGGNLSLQAPEIRRSKPKKGKIIDFSMADLWSTGTMGYEIFTRINPFYSRLNSKYYEEDDLAQLPRRLHYAVKEVTYKMLRVDPKQRPKPHVAANVVSISLFRFGKDVKTFLEECGLSVGWDTKQLKNSFSKTLKTLGQNIEKRLDDVTQLYAAETILSKFLNPQIISNAELQLRATFLSRLNKEDIWPAMEYFFDEHVIREHSNNSSSGSSTIGYIGNGFQKI
uniref:Protein kinase domain-containing protein n=1 Tax=Panagrolaimus sp. JU765 TaxID=591449 RepID=A0AC34R6V2_9BILA